MTDDDPVDVANRTSRTPSSRSEAAAAAPGRSASALGCVGLALLPMPAVFFIAFSYEQPQRFVTRPPSIASTLLAFLEGGLLSGLWQFPWVASALIFSLGLFGVRVDRKLAFWLLLTTISVFALPMFARALLEYVVTDARTDWFTTIALSILGLLELFILRLIYTSDDSETWRS